MHISSKHSGSLLFIQYDINACFGGFVYGIDIHIVTMW